MIFFMIPISIMSVCTWPVDNNSICGNIVINNEYCDLHKLQDNTDTDTCIYDRKYYKEIAKLNNISAMRTIMKNVNEMKYMIVYILWYSTLDVVIWLIKEYNDAIIFTTYLFSIKSFVNIFKFINIIAIIYYRI